MKILDTFAGIGGFSYAAEKLIGGFETTQFIEINPFCQKVLKKHWPHVPIHDDIKTFTAYPGQYDVITGGFPCQDLSVAGQRRGITKESRSGLFYELIRVIRMVRPKFVVLENVAAILNNGLDIVLGELSEAGYDAEWAVISASSLGAAHRRSRWWLVAYPNNNGSPTSEKSRSTEKTDGGAEERKNQACQSQGGSEPRDTETIQLNASDPDSIRCGRGNSQRCSVQERQLFSGEQKGSEMGSKTKRCSLDTSYPNSNRLQRKIGARIYRSAWNTQNIRCLNPNWRQYESEPCLLRGANGLSNRVDRLRALGNSVVPQCAAIPLQRVKDLYATTS